MKYDTISVTYYPRLDFSGNKAEKIANILGIPFFFEYCFLRNGYFEIEKNKQYLSHGIIGHYKIDKDTEIEVSIRENGYPALNFSCRRNYTGKNGSKAMTGALSQEVYDLLKPLTQKERYIKYRELKNIGDNNNAHDVT